MSKNILVMWAGDFYRPTLYSVPITALNVELNTNDTSKLYMIDDMVRSDLLKHFDNVEVYAEPSEFDGTLNVNSSLNTDTIINFKSIHWRAASKLQSALYVATLHLKDYLEAVEECIYFAFSNEFKHKIEFLTISDIPKHSIYIGYNVKEENLVVYITEYKPSVNLKTNEELTPFTLQSKLGTIFSITIVPKTLSKEKHIVELFLNAVNDKYNFSLTNTVIENTAKTLSTLIEYLHAFDNIDLPLELKSQSKLLAVKYHQVPKIIILNK